MADQPRSKGGFNLGDYVEVKDRIKLFYDRYEEGAIVTDRVEIWTVVCRCRSRRCCWELRAAGCATSIFMPI